MIAMALANEPDLLIADEPTTALDVTVQAQIIALLQGHSRRGSACRFCSSPTTSASCARSRNRICVMKEGKIVEQGDVERVFTAPEHPYTRALLAAEPKPDPAPPQPDAPVVLEATDLKVWFPIKRGLLRKVVGHIKAVDGVSIDLRKGETLGVVGKSGSGKTTLGLALLRLISSEGPIVFMGNALQGLRFKQMRPFRRDMQIVFQDPYGSLSPRMSVAEIIKEGLSVHHPDMPEHERDARVVQALNDVGLDPATRFRFPHEFSGGQRQRIAVARAIVLEPTFIVLDEPTSALDMLIQSQMVDLLREPAEAPQSHLSVHLARPAGGRRAGEPAVGDAAGQGGGGRRRRRLVQKPEERLYARAVCRSVQSGNRARRRGGAVMPAASASRGAGGGVEGTFVRTAQAGSNALGSRSVGVALLRRRRGGLAGR